MDKIRLLQTYRRSIWIQGMNLNRHIVRSSSPALHQVRCMGGHGTPAHWKPIKQICLENKNHMNCMPVPEGSWQESYSKRQQTYNLFLAASVLVCGATYAFVELKSFVSNLYKSGVLHIGPYIDVKNFKVAASSSGSQAQSTGNQESNSNNNAGGNQSSPTPEPSSAAAAASGSAAAASSPEPTAAVLPELPPHAQYLLIGAGTASFGAYRAIKAKDPKAKILIVGEEAVVPYMRPPLSKELWSNENKEEVAKLQFRQWNGRKRSLFYEPEEFFAKPQLLSGLENGGIAMATGKKVVKIDASKKSVWLASGETITYDKCLIATGGKPKSLAVLEKDPEVQKRTVLFRNVEDFKRLDSALETAESVAIVGGGFLGSELACALSKRGKKSGLKVYQLYPEEGNMRRVLPEYLSKWTTKKVENEGAIVKPGQTVNKAAFKDGKVVLSTKEGETVSADCVVAAVGLEPNIELAKASGLEVDPVQGGYLVNAELEARRDLWVAGDAACFFDMKLGRRRVEHHDHAVVSGRLAGENMTGAAKPYWHQSMFWSDLGPDVGYEAIGIVDSKLPTVAVFAKASAKDTPKAVVEQTGEGLRSETENSPASPAPVKGESSPLDSEDYGKGIVFYLGKDKTVVGILLWNVFSKMSIARQVLKDGAKNEDLYEVAKLFELHDTDEEDAASS